MSESMQPEIAQREASATDLGSHNYPFPPGTSLDLPPCFVDMSPVEPAYKEIIEKYGQPSGQIAD